MVQYVNEISEHKFRNKHISLIVKFYEQDYAYVSMQWHGDYPFYRYGLAGDLFDDFYKAVCYDKVAGRWLLRLMRNNVEDFDIRLAEWKAFYNDECFDVLRDVVKCYAPYTKKWLYNESIYRPLDEKRMSRIQKYWPQISKDNLHYFQEIGYGQVRLSNIKRLYDMDMPWPKNEIECLLSQVPLYEPSTERMMQYVREEFPLQAEELTKLMLEQVDANQHIKFKIYFTFSESIESEKVRVSLQLSTCPVKKAKRPNH